MLYICVYIVRLIRMLSKYGIYARYVNIYVLMYFI